jgi:hypothetical protein
MTTWINFGGVNERADLLKVELQATGDGRGKEFAEQSLSASHNPVSQPHAQILEVGSIVCHKRSLKVTRIRRNEQVCVIFVRPTAATARHPDLSCVIPHGPVDVCPKEITNQGAKFL